MNHFDFESLLLALTVMLLAMLATIIMALTSHAETSVLRLHGEVLILGSEHGDTASKLN